MRLQLKKMRHVVMFACLLSISMPRMSMPVLAAVLDDSAIVSGSAAVIQTTKPKVEKKEKKQDNWKVSLKKVSHPKKLKRGYGFDVKGNLVSVRKIKYVKAEIKSESGKVLYRKKAKVNKKKYNLKKMDNALKFSKLDKGDYKYNVTVIDQKKNEKDVIEDDFTVQQPQWMIPVSNPRFGDGWHCRCSTHRGRHYGWDILGGGLSIHAASTGTVVYAKYHSGSGLGSFGKLIVLYHGKGIYSYYAHCSKIKVKVGQKVVTGDIIGKTGSSGMSSGAHLHFELRKGPEFDGKNNNYKLIDKYTYKQFNPAKKIKR